MNIGKHVVEPMSPTRGDTNSFRFAITGQDGVELVPDAAYFSVKRHYEDTEYIFKKSLNNGISLMEEITNDDGTLTKIYKVRVAPEDTESLPLGKYFYDLELTFGDDVYTPLKGPYNITFDVTGRNR